MFYIFLNFRLVCDFKIELNTNVFQYLYFQKRFYTLAGDVIKLIFSINPFDVEV